MPLIEEIASFDNEPDELDSPDEALEPANSSVPLNVSPSISSSEPTLDFSRDGLDLQSYIHSLSKALEVHVPPESEIEHSNTIIFTSNHVEEITSSLRLAWDHSRILCVILSRLMVIFESSYSHMKSQSTLPPSSSSRKSRREVWSNVYNLVALVAERGRVDNALSMEERVSFYKLIHDEAPLDVIKAKNLIGFIISFLQVISMNIEGGFTSPAVSELLGFLHILEGVVKCQAPAFRMAVDGRGGELVCRMIEVMAPLKGGGDGNEGEVRDRLIVLCRELVIRGANGNALRDVEELRGKCTVLRPLINEIVQR